MEILCVKILKMLLIFLMKLQRNLIFGALPTHLSLIPKAKSSINPFSSGIYHLKEEDSLKAQLAAMAREVETLKSKLPKKVNSIARQEIFEICEVCCVLGHITKECPTLPAFREMFHDQENFVNQFKKPSTFSETYNPGWRNHPNFSWRNNTNNNVPQQKSISFYFSPQMGKDNHHHQIWKML